jgi:CRP/FNR family transcriptional regulator, anaerobic regulatory protein
LSDLRRPESGQLILPLTRNEMADYLGLRVETVSRQLKRLEEDGGIIKRIAPRHILVPDVRGLAQIAGPDLAL